MKQRILQQKIILAAGGSRRFSPWRATLIALFLPAISFATSALAAEAPQYRSLDIYPPQVTLNHADDYQHVIAVAKREDGVTRDVTGEVEWKLDSSEADNDTLQLKDGIVRASRNGMARLHAEWSGLKAEADLQAAGIEVQRDISYRHDVIPIFLRAGCNSGGCHGSSRGKDGFRLSLFGFDPAGDHFRLTRELVGRRLNFAIPEESLLLTKATAAAAHTGGKRFEADTVYYEKLREWIAKGAPNDLEGAASVTGVRLYPPAVALEPGSQAEAKSSPDQESPSEQMPQQQMVVVADYSDGSTRDVSHLALFQSNNDAAAKINTDGLVTASGSGEAFVMARFDTHTVGSQVLSLPSAKDFQPNQVAAGAGYIDQMVTRKLNTMRIAASPVCTDEEFLRRATIDITGQLPTPEARAAFLADESPDKRAKKIDALLAQPELAVIWGSKWADLLLVRSEANRVEYKATFLYAKWLRRQLAAGVPLDELVRDLLTAQGTSFDTPAVNFYQAEQDPKKTAENVAQSLLGVRIQCAQCHNHPFDRWTMDDYYAFTGFFTQIGRKRGEDYRENIVFDRRQGDSRHPVGNRVMKPKFLGGDEPDTSGVDRRAVVADWITSPDNPYFAPSVANRIWAHFFGVGVVEPVDDIRVSNPPSNGELFDALGEKLVEYKYDYRKLVRDICNSETYQRSSRANHSNAGDTRNFARAMPRRMTAETLLDCLSQATESSEKLPGLPLGSKAVELADGKVNHYFLQTFGRASRVSVCACESDAQPTLSQALHLINGGTTNDKIGRGNLVKRWMDEGRTPNEALDSIYLRCLTRLPTDDERKQYAAILAESEKPQDALEDIFWAVLNSREFLFNH